MVHKLINIYTKLQEPVTVQYIFLWARGRQTQGPPRAAHILATPLPSFLCWGARPSQSLCLICNVNRICRLHKFFMNISC